MAFQITRPGMSRKCKALFFGPYGAGKTDLLGTAEDDPRTSPMFLMDFEGGSDTLEDRREDGMHIERIASWAEYDQAYDFLVNDRHDFKSVGIDSITETNMSAIFEILDREGPSRAEKDKRTNVVEPGDYGESGIQLRRFIRTWRDLHAHLFLTALDRSDIVPREGTVIKPALIGRLADEIPGIVNVVGYLTTGIEEETKESVHVLVLKNYRGIRSKIRVPRSWQDIPDELIEPTVGDLLDILRFPLEEEVEETATVQRRRSVPKSLK